MSGQFPVAPKPSSIDLKSVTPTLYSEGQDGRVNTRQFGVHKWQISLSFPNTLSRDQIDPIVSFLLAQQGRFNSFQLLLDNLSTPKGTGSGTPVIAGAGQTGVTLATSGWAANETVLKAGDIVKFAGHTKVYMIASDVTSDATGLASIVLNTPVISAVADLEAVQVSGVMFTVSNSSDEQSYNVYGPMLHNLSVTLIEDF